MRIQDDGWFVAPMQFIEEELNLFPRAHQFAFEEHAPPASCVNSMRCLYLLL
jgi:hypothetical protein